MLDINDKYKKALEYHGYENQKHKFDEELIEFNEATTNAEQKLVDIHMSGIIEGMEKEVLELESEAADIINMIKQKVLFLGGDPDNVDNICISKMIREEKRVNKAIETGVYEKN